MARKDDEEPTPSEKDSGVGPDGAPDSASADNGDAAASEDTSSGAAIVTLPAANVSTPALHLGHIHLFGDGTAPNTPEAIAPWGGSKAVFKIEGGNAQLAARLLARANASTRFGHRVTAVERSTVDVA